MSDVDESGGKGRGDATLSESAVVCANRELLLGLATPVPAGAPCWQPLCEERGEVVVIA